MRPVLNRRDVLKAIGAPALGAPLALCVAADAPRFSRMPAEGKEHAEDLPRLLRLRGRRRGMRRVKQIGVDYVLTGGPQIPWDEGRPPRPDRALQGRRPHALQPDDLGVRRRDLGAAGSRRADRERDHVDPRRRQGRPARHRIQLLREPADGGLQGGEGPRRRGLHRLRLRALEEPAAHATASARTPAPSSSKRAERFLKAVVPEAEKANVRLALHPNDPPVPLSRGSEQLMATVEHWKRVPGSRRRARSTA